MSDQSLMSMVRSIARIRAFEMHLLGLFSQGKLFGTTHTCVGQELCATALYEHIDPRRDAVFSNHRCHGHFLAFGGAMKGLLAEIMGRQAGVCRGRGGSQHLCSGGFFSNGVQGGGLPNAAGYAYQTQLSGNGGIVVAHIGDGTLGEGTVYETLNLAALLSLPLLIVLEHNGYAQSTDTSHTTAGDYVRRFAGFGIEFDRRPANDPVSLSEHLAQVVAYVRAGRPFVQVMDTFRLMPHSKGDDNRPKEMLRQAWQEDYFARALDNGDPIATEAWAAAQAEIKAVSACVEGLPAAKIDGVWPYAEPTEHMFRSSADLLFPAASDRDPSRRINEQLCLALERIMAEAPEVVLIGEDVADPYGGAFKVTRGLSTKYPDRVLSAPISEAGIVGLGNGMALNGGRPIVEIMFGDFVTLAMDQLINQAAKMYYMYAGQVSVPITIRLVSGGYRGYGATHSQSLESRLCGVPGLEVVAISRRHDPLSLLEAVVRRDNNPVVFVENKLLYTKRPHTCAPPGFRFLAKENSWPERYPALAYTTVDDGKADITVVTYGGMTDMVEEAMEETILEEELDFDYFILTQLHPLWGEDVAKSVARTRRLVVVEEGATPFGVGAELVAQVQEHPEAAGFRSFRLGAQPVPIPCSRVQEEHVLPSKGRIVEALMRLYDEG